MANDEPTRKHRRPLAHLLGVDRGPGAGLLAMFVVVGVVLVLAHLSMKVTGNPAEYTWDLGADRGFGEFFSYMLIGWATLLTALLALQRRSAVLAAWSAVCGYYLLDDALQIHEWAGFAVADRLPHWGEPAIHLGELAWMAMVGVVLATAVVLTHRRATRRDRAVSAVLVMLFALLIAVGVGLDAIHHLLLSAPVFDVPFTTLEDGAEIMLASVLVAFLFSVAFAGHQPVPRGRLARLLGPRA